MNPVKTIAYVVFTLGVLGFIVTMVAIAAAPDSSASFATSGIAVMVGATFYAVLLWAFGDIQENVARMAKMMQAQTEPHRFSMSPGEVVEADAEVKFDQTVDDEGSVWYIVRGMKAGHDGAVKLRTRARSKMHAKEKAVERGFTSIVSVEEERATATTA